MPQTLRWAAWLAFAYAGVVLANATIGQMTTDWVDAKDYVRGLIRTVGYIAIGVGLLRRSKIAWWAGIGISAWLLLLALFAFGVLLALRTPEAVAALPPFFIPVAVTTTSLLVAIVVLLAHPSTRAAIRAPAV